MGVKSDASVIVVGAGPVGLLVGLRLAKAGIQTTVLEALPAIENSPRAAVYQPVGVEELDRAGVLADCRRIGTFGTSLAWRKVTGEPIVELKRTPTSHEPYENLVLGQHELAEVIGNHFKACENSQILFEHSVVAIEQDDKGITARVETPEGERTFTASYLVGADGGKSTIRRVTGVSFEGFTWREQIVATNVVYPFEEYGYSAGNQIVDPVYFAVVAKLNDQGLYRVSYGEEPDLSLEEIKARQPMKYEAILPGPRPLKYDLKMLSPYRIHQRCSSRFRIGRIFLAGDAAHLCNPFGGLGLTGGLLDAGALGDALIAHINDGYPESILDRYDEVRRGVFHDYINPISQANLRRLKDTDPDTVRETDPFFQSLVAADSSKSEKIRGNRQLRIPILEV